MEYPFKDLLPREEVTARQGYYKDWSHIDANTFHQISELAKFIREKGHGADTREAMAQALERVYHDAAKSGNANMEVSMARGGFDTLGERLNDTDAQLRQTIRLDDDNLSLNNFKESDRAIIQGLADGEINAVLGVKNVKTKNIDDNTIGDLQLKYPLARTAASTNLFDKTDIIDGYYVSYATGELVPQATYTATKKMDVIPGSKITVKYHNQTAFSDINGKFLVGKGISATPAPNALYTFDVPVDAHYMQISTLKTNVEAQQMNYGTALLAYETGAPKLQMKSVEDRSIPAEKIKAKSIGDEETKYPLLRAVPSTNLYDTKLATKGQYVSSTTGSLVDAPQYEVLEGIKIEPNTTYTIAHLNQSVFRDSSGKFISGLPATLNANGKWTFTTPANAVKMDITTLSKLAGNQQLNKGDQLVAYENANPKITTDSIKQGAGYDWFSNSFILPKKLYLLTNIDYSISAYGFNKNSFKDNDRLLFELGMPTKFETFRKTVGVSSPFEVEFETRLVGMYDENNSNALFKPVTLDFKNPESVTNKSPKILHIGDSITHGSLPPYTKWWLEKNGMTPTMIGTLNNRNHYYGYGIVGEINYEKGEGRGGWRLTDFTGTSVKEDGSPVTNAPLNPFLNPDTGQFDFSYYMNTNGFDGVDYIHFQLGTNDIIGYRYYDNEQYRPTIEEIIEYMPTNYQLMIDSIHQYDPSIKIAISPPPLGGFNEVFNHKSKLFADELFKTFDGTQNNVYVLAGSHLGNGTLSGSTHTDGISHNESDLSVIDSNGTKRGPISNDIHDTELNTSVNGLWIASWIINVSD